MSDKLKEPLETNDNVGGIGFRGKKNIYTCDKCFGHIVTVDVDRGVTPFTIDCKVTFDCKGWMQSSMYRVFDQSMRADYEWYRPSTVEAHPFHMQEHIQRGGLILREARS